MVLKAELFSLQNVVNQYLGPDNRLFKKGMDLQFILIIARCKKYRQSKEKWIYVDWDTNTKKLFEVDIKISVANKTGVLQRSHQCYQSRHRH